MENHSLADNDTYIDTIQSLVKNYMQMLDYADYPLALAEGYWAQSGDGETEH